MSKKLIISIIAAVAAVSTLAAYQNYISPKETPSPAPQAPQAVSTTDDTDETASLKTYRNEEFGFEVQYPSMFELQIERDTSIVGFNCFLLGLFREGEGNIGKPVGESEFYVSINCPGRGLQGVQSQDDLVDGRKATRYYWKYPDTNKKDILVVYLREGSSFNFGVAGVNNIEEQLFNQILSTFKFTE